MPHYFWMLMWTKNVNNSKISTSGYCSAFDWFFCQFQSDAAYKSVTYRKSMYYIKLKIIWDYTFFHNQLGSDPDAETTSKQRWSNFGTHAFSCEFGEISKTHLLQNTFERLLLFLPFCSEEKLNWIYFF